LSTSSTTARKAKAKRVSNGGQERARNSADGRPDAAAGYIENWDEYFLTLAETVKRKSKDPRCQVGAVIVSPDGNVVVTTGFNGLARGVFDDVHVLRHTPEKLRWICHAESNAILNASRTGVALSGCTMYVTKFPCLACCNDIVQAGIARIYTHDTRYWSDDPADRNHTRKRKLLKQAGVQIDAPFHPDFMPRTRVTTDGSNGYRIIAERRRPARRAGRASPTQVS